MHFWREDSLGSVSCGPKAGGRLFQKSPDLCGLCLKQRRIQVRGRGDLPPPLVLDQTEATKHVQLVLQHCSKTSWIAMLHVLLPTKTNVATLLLGSKGGAVVRALTSHQCGPGLNPGVDAICGLSLLLVLSLASRVFLRVLWFSPLLKKPTLSNSNSIWNAQTRFNEFLWTP